jgi:hypothetical protein
MERNGPAGRRPPLGAVDLSALRGGTELPPDIKAAALEEGELRAGLRCGGCRQRVSHGFEFTLIRAEYRPELASGGIKAEKRVACADPECGYAVQCVEIGAVAMREVKYMFLDEGAAGRVLGALGVTPEEEKPDD